MTTSKHWIPGKQGTFETHTFHSDVFSNPPKGDPYIRGRVLRSITPWEDLPDGTSLGGARVVKGVFTIYDVWAGVPCCVWKHWHIRGVYETDEKMLWDALQALKELVSKMPTVVSTTSRTVLEVGKDLEFDFDPNGDKVSFRVCRPYVEVLVADLEPSKILAEVWMRLRLILRDLVPAGSPFLEGVPLVEEEVAKYRRGLVLLETEVDSDERAKIQRVLRDLLLREPSFADLPPL